MRDYLLDLVQHTVPLGAFKSIRIDGTDTETEIAATEGDRQLVLRGRLHKPSDDLVGTFGIPNISLLNTLLNISEYKDVDAKFSVLRETREGTVQPVSISFENKDGDFKNEFRLTASNIINSLEPKSRFKINTWAAEFSPSVVSQQRLKYQTQANPTETAVTFKVRGGDIIAHVGDIASHSGSFKFHTGVDASISKAITVPLDYVNAVLSLNGDKVIRIGDFGMMISVDSGLANYDYILPTFVK